MVCMPVSAQTTGAFADIPGVRFDYYDASGDDAAAIRRSIDAARPTDAHDGQRVDALTTWRMRWSWPTRTRGCDLGKARVTFAATVRMPRLAVVPDAVKPAWDRYVAALERHEAGHARHGYNGRAAVLAAIRGATCATADAAATAALAKLDAFGVQYDRETRHGMTQGAVFP